MLRAADLYWDANGSSSGVGGAGTWASSSTWRTGGTSGALGNWIDGSNAFLPQGAATITLNSTVTANALEFQNTSGGYTISGSGTLTLSGSSTITLDNSTTQKINVAIAGGDVRLVNNAAGTRLALGGTNTFTGNLILGGGGSSASDLNRVDIVAANALPSTATVNFAGSFGAFGNDGSSLSLTLSNNFNLNSTGTGTFESFIGATSGNAMTINGTISGGSNLTFSAGSSGGAGTITLGATNSYTGSTTINNALSGIVRLGVTNALPSATSLVVGSTQNAGTLDFNGMSQTVATLSSGGGTFTGTINNSAASTTGTLTISGTATPVAFAGVIADGVGKIAVTRAGSGSTTFAGANTYTGATAINGGTLFVNGAIVAGSAVTIGGGTLAGSGTAAGTISLNSGTISPGASATNGIGRLTTGAQSWANGGNYNWQLFNATGSAGVAFDQIAAPSLDLSALGAGGFKLNLWSLSAINSDTNGNATNFVVSNNQSWAILATTAGIAGFNAGNFTINLSGTNGTGGFTNSLNGGSFSISLGNSGNDLVLNFTAAASVALTWSPAGGTSWNTGVAANWLNGGSRTTFGTNNNVTLGDTGVGNVSIDAAGVTPGTVTVANTSGTYTFTGGAIGGSGPLTKNSTGTLLLQNTNSYSGSTIINGGVVQLGVANALPSATGVTLSNTTGALLNLANNNQIIGSLSGGGNSGGNVALGSGTLTVGDGNSTSFAGVLSGAGGSLIKQGAGTLLLGNTSSYTGSTTINAGSLRSGTANALPAATAVTLANVAGATLDLDGNNQTIASLAGGGSIGGNVTLGAATLTVGDSSNTTFGGTLSGAGSLVKQGSGMLSVAGLGYAGTTTISAGTLLLSATGGTVTLNTDSSGAAFAGNLAIANGIRVNFQSGSFSGGGQIQAQKTGAQLAATTGASTPVIGNNIVLNSGSAAGAFNTFLGATSAVTLTVSGTISGASDLTFAAGTSGGAGTVVLNATNSYTGPVGGNGPTTTFNNAASGVIRLGVSNALPTATSLVFGGSQNAGILDLNGCDQTVASLSSGGGSFTGTITNNATGTSTLTISGTAAPAAFAGVISDGGAGKIVALTLPSLNTGRLTLTGNSTYTGGTKIDGGTLGLGSGNILADTGAVSLGGGTLDIGANRETVGAVTLVSGTIAGTGTLKGSSFDVRSGVIAASLGEVNGSPAALTKSGVGTVTMSGSMSYTGATQVNGGRLIVSGSISGSVTTVNNGGTLGGSGSVDALTIASGGTLSPGNSPGAFSAKNTTFEGGGNINLQLQNATGTAGIDWDLLAVTGVLDFSSLSSTNQFNLNLWTLGSVNPDVSGPMSGFDRTQNYSWTIVTATGGFAGSFSSSIFHVNTSAFNGADGFSNPFDGTFSVVENGSNLELQYAIPEPSACAMFAGGIAILILLRRRQPGASNARTATKTPARLRAFTLVELLVVMAIIALLASLALPAFGHVQLTARRVSSLNMMRQLAIMTINYAASHDDALPAEKAVGGADTWQAAAQPANSEVWYNALPKLCGMNSVAEYAGNPAAFYATGSLFYCPAAARPKSLAAPLFAYAMNSKLNQPKPILLSDIQSPSQTALFIEAGLPGEKPVYSKQAAYNGQPNAYASRFVARYNGSGVVTFADGHAEAVKGRDAVASNGKAFSPQSQGKVIWTADPSADANQ